VIVVGNAETSLLRSSFFTEDALVKEVVMVKPAGRVLMDV